MPKSVVNKTLCMKNLDSMVNGFEIKMMVYQAQFISKMAGLAVLINQ
jgi:hypothetical protein